MDGDVAKMRPVEAIDVVPGDPTVLQPGGLHVMLMGLNQKLDEGGTLPLTLIFERAGEVTFDVPIRGMKGASGHMQPGQNHGTHSGG